MIYNQDDDFNFLSDKKIGEVGSESQEYRRRGGAYQKEAEKPVEKKVVPVEENQIEAYDEKPDFLTMAVIALAVIVVVIAIIVMLKVVGGDSNTTDTKEENNGGIKIEQSTTNNKPIEDNKNNNTTNNNNSNSSKLSIANLNETYNVYPIKIESIVDKKGGNFFNNNDKIKGDKVYVEYKQISGMKDTDKQEKINEKLKNLSVELYDQNYLSDKEVLFVDITTKLSVNFDTLSYVVYRQGQDIDGNEFKTEIKTLNLKLDTLEEISFEDLFIDNTDIKALYPEYVKGKVDKYYFTPDKIYVYDEKYEETEIDMAVNYSKIAIYKRFLTNTELFEEKSVSQKVFTVKDTNTSDKTTDRAFEKTK